MNRFTHTFIAALADMSAGIASAQAPASANPPVSQVLKRDINQEQRIGNGLQSGTLTTREAGTLQRQEARVDQLQANALRDGTLTPQEQARINAKQNQVSREIRADKTNARVGNPDSLSSQRMQANVQRNINQEQRIANGVAQGQLSNRQTAALEAGQARVHRKQARAARNGHVNAAEQARVQGTQNLQSHRIHAARKTGPGN